MVRDIFLYGRAGRLFGRHFRLDVASPREAARALCVLRPGLRELLRAGLWRVIVGKPHIANGVAADALDMRLGHQSLHLVPVTRPRGSDGGVLEVGKIIVGVILIGSAIILSGGTLAAPLIGMSTVAFEIGGLGITYGAIAALGVSMVLAGVSGLLTPQMDKPATDMAAPGDTPSFVFNGARNNTQPGGPVPLIYGTMLAGSVIVYTSLQVTDIPQWFV